MLEFDFFVVSSHLQHGVHVTKCGTKNKLVALAGKVAEYAFCIGALGHFLNKAGNDLVAKFFFKRLASVVVCKSPTAITDGAHICKSHFKGLSLGCCSGRLGFFFLATSHQGSCSND